MKVLVIGGSKSGKSDFSQEIALSLAQGKKHYYVATMISSGKEDDDRIRRHIADRDGMGFETVECFRNIEMCRVTIHEGLHRNLFLGGIRGHIQLQGWGRPQYVNTQYPWEGHEFRRPAYSLLGKAKWEGMFSEAEYNPVGLFVGKLCKFFFKSRKFFFQFRKLCAEEIFVTGIFADPQTIIFHPGKIHIVLREKDIQRIVRRKVPNL